MKLVLDYFYEVGVGLARASENVVFFTPKRCTRSMKLTSNLTLVEATLKT